MVSVIDVVRVRECAVFLSLCRAKNTHETIRIFHRPRPQHDGVKRCEDRGVHSDSEREGKNGGRRKAEVFSHHAQAEAQVLENAIDETDSARLAAFFLGALYAAKLNTRPPQRLSTANAAARQILRARLDVEPQLRVHLALHPPAPQNGQQPKTKAAPEGHTSSGVVCRIPAITSAMRFHFSASVCNLRLPAA